MTFRCLPQNLLIIQSSSCTISSSQRIKLDHSSWSSGNISMYAFSIRLIMIAVFRTHSSHGTKQAGTEQCGELRRAALTQGSPQCCFFSTQLFRKMNCAEKTVRNKIGKMTYLHIYFDSYGVTKFTKSQRYGWQVGFCIGCSKNNSLIQALVFTKTFVPKLRSKDGSF